MLSIPGTVSAMRDEVTTPAQAAEAARRARIWAKETAREERQTDLLAALIEHLAANPMEDPADQLDALLFLSRMDRRSVR